MAYRWRPSKAARAEFAETMKEVETFCQEHGIKKSLRSDSYYFTIDGQKYRVSNHSVEASNEAAFRENMFGEIIQTRELYHEGGREDDTIYIHASKTRLIQIYNDLKAGKKLDGRGRVQE